MNTVDFSGIYIPSLFKENVCQKTPYNNEHLLSFFLIINGNGKIKGKDISEKYFENQIVISETSLVLEPEKPTDIYYGTIMNPVHIVKSGIYTVPDSSRNLNFLRSVAGDIENGFRDIEGHSLKVYSYFIELNKDKTEISGLIKNALDIVHEEYSSITGVEEVALNLGVTNSHLVREFKKAVGITPGKYIEKIRIDRSILLMTYTDYSLDIIANMIGLSSSNYFCRIFKKSTGQTPNSFRKKTKKTKLTVSEKKLLSDIENTYLI